MSSRELARRNFMSSTAVLRCIKKLGFQNYNDFKLNLNGWLRSYSVEEIHVAENDELLDLMNKMTTFFKRFVGFLRRLTEYFRLPCQDSFGQPGRLSDHRDKSQCCLWQ